MDLAQLDSTVLMALLVEYGLRLLGAVVILAFGLIVAGRARRFAESSLGRLPRVDPTLSKFLATFAQYLIVAFTFLAVLDRFGVETTSLVALLGVAGLAVGLALQGTLSNLAAGVMLLVFRPFRLGDYVEAGGHAGTVRDISLLTTELATPDNIQVLLPNAGIWGQPIKNYSHNPTRRIDLVVGVAYGTDMAHVVDVMRRMIGSDERCLSDPEPLVAVESLGDSAVNVLVRVWCRTADYWDLRFGLTRSIKEHCDRSGIAIPFPQRDIHIRNGKAATA